MSTIYPPTSSTLDISLPDGTLYRAGLQFADETIGASNLAYNARATEEPKRLLKSISNKQVANQVKNLIHAIDETIHGVSASGGDISALPPLRAYYTEDESVSLEWVLPDFRLGFTIQVNPNESGWHLATSKRMGESGSYGFLSRANLRSLVFIMVSYVLANS